MRKYCVVLIIPNYHLQLCGSIGYEQLSYKEARDQALQLQKWYPKYFYGVYMWEDFLQSKDALKFRQDLLEPCGVAHEKAMLDDLLKGI